MIGDCPVLLRMPDIEILGILKITCEVVEDQQGCSQFDLLAIEPTGALNCRMYTKYDSRSGSVGIINNNSNIILF